MPPVPSGTASCIACARKRTSGSASSKRIDSAATSALGALREHGGVLALGSGAVLDTGIQALLGGLPVVYLSADFGTVARRIGLDRPRVVVPGNPRGRLRTMLDERDMIYQRLAAITVPTDDLDPAELADRIAAEITT